jgi:hypothetical protein
MPSRSYIVTRVILDKRSTDPPATIKARIYYNTVDNRPKICIENA